MRILTRFACRPTHALCDFFSCPLALCTSRTRLNIPLPPAVCCCLSARCWFAVAVLVYAHRTPRTATTRYTPHLAARATHATPHYATLTSSLPHLVCACRGPLAPPHQPFASTPFYTLHISFGPPLRGCGCSRAGPRSCVRVSTRTADALTSPWTLHGRTPPPRLLRLTPQHRRRCRLVFFCGCRFVSGYAPAVYARFTAQRMRAFRSFASTHTAFTLDTPVLCAGLLDCTASPRTHSPSLPLLRCYTTTHLRFTCIPVVSSFLTRGFIAHAWFTSHGLLPRLALPATPFHFSCTALHVRNTTTLPRLPEHAVYLSLGGFCYTPGSHAHRIRIRTHFITRTDHLVSRFLNSHHTAARHLISTGLFGTLTVLPRCRTHLPVVPHLGLTYLRHAAWFAHCALDAVLSPRSHAGRTHTLLAFRLFHGFTAFPTFSFTFLRFAGPGPRLHGFRTGLRLPLVHTVCYVPTTAFSCVHAHLLVRFAALVPARVYILPPHGCPTGSFAAGCYHTGHTKPGFAVSRFACP